MAAGWLDASLPSCLWRSSWPTSATPRATPWGFPPSGARPPSSRRHRRVPMARPAETSALQTASAARDRWSRVRSCLRPPFPSHRSASRLTSNPSREHRRLSITPLPC